MQIKSIINVYMKENNGYEGNMLIKNVSLQWSPKLFLVCRTKCPADIQSSAGHFDSLLDILLPEVQQIGIFLPDILCTYTNNIVIVDASFVMEHMI